MQEIIEGIVIGIVAGVTTAGLLSAYHCWIRYRARQEQICHIRDLISDQMGQILSITEFSFPEHGKERIPADKFRFMLFRKFQSALHVAVSSRATALKYEQEAALRDVLADIERAIMDLPLDKIGIPMGFADSFYEKLQALSWLRLPKRDS